MIGCGEYANGGSEDCTEYWDGKWYVLLDFFGLGSYAKC
jgi:hypothetical protein